MLKLKADAQPAGEPGKTRGTAVRIEGVSAPKNMKIGLVASSAGQDGEASAGAKQAKAPLAEVKPAAKGAAGNPKAKPAETAAAKPARAAAAAKKPSASQTVQKPGKTRQALPEPQPFAPVQAEGGSALPKLGLAAAGLAVASAMLLYFQFGGGAPAETAAPAPQQTAAAEAAAAEELQPSGAASAAALETAETSGEDELVARITAGTLAALRSKQTLPEAAAEAPAAPAEGTALFKMVMTAAAQGQSEAYIDQLVNGAYERQEITVPASLIGADGRVDTATLLALFVGN